MKPSLALLISVMALLVFALGWLGNDIYRSSMNKRLVDGLFVAPVSQQTAYETSKKSDFLGNWVCVNIKGMDYSRAVEVCQHEVGHEMFAEHCEDDFEGCLEVVK